VVIVRYLTADAIGMSIDGGIKSNSGSHTIHTFSQLGTLEVDRPKVIISRLMTV
jgi:hypothetical protein